jgi:hypothetical protein
LAAGLVVVVAMLAGIGGGTPPVAAETRLEVTAGYAGGNYVPGRGVPVRVTITADRLVHGTLEVRLDQLGTSVPIRVPVEVPGGSEKEYLVVLPTLIGAGRVQVDARLLGDDAAAGEVDVSFTGDTELVGLLPGLVPSVPGAQPLENDLGTARFHELRDDELATPGALEALGTIVVGPEGLSPLAETARSNLLTWIDQGGRLVVDAAAGGPVAGLPDPWQPGGDDRRFAGRGEVRLAGGAVADGRWAELIEPTSLAEPGEVGNGGFFGMNGGVGATIAADGGLRVPAIGWLVAFLVAYVALAGPVVFLVLRKVGRAGWTWFAVPGVAVVFAIGAFVVGSDLRTGNETAHGTAVETGPAGSRAFSYVGLVSRSGADADVRFPEGWQATGLVSPMFDDMGPARLTSGPSDVLVQGDGTVGEVELAPGGFGMLTGWGPIDPTPGLEVTAVAAADGSVRGTVRNTTDLLLRDILIMVGVRAWGGGSLQPGESADWELGPGAGLSADTWSGLAEGPWIDATGWNGPPDRASAVNYDMWTDWRSRLVDPYPQGLVTAAGWTEDWSPPLDSGRPVNGGRTVFTTQAEVGVETDGTVPLEAVRREYVRGDRTTTVDADPNIANEWGDSSGAVVRFTLPPGADQGRRLELDVPSVITGVELLVDGRWTEVRPADGTRGGEGGPLLDPGDPISRTEIAVPAGAVDDGQLYARIGYVSGISPLWGFTLREANA